MKLLLRALMLTLFFPAAPSFADVPPYVTGIEYQEIIPAQHSTAPAGKIEVVELFWYGCSHCYRLEPELKKWLKNKPKNIHFVRMPAQFNPQWELHAGAYYTAQALGIIDKTHTDTFKEIHEKRNRLATVDALAAFYLRYGISRDNFMKVYESPAVRNRKAHAKGMVQRYGAKSVPTFVINGKYRTNESLAGSKPEMFAVIEALVAAEAKLQKTPANK